MSPRLALHFLGLPQIHLDGVPITLERRKALALLAYLAIERGIHPRESLSALLWPDFSQPNAFKNLRQTLWEVQRILGEGWLIADREQIGLADEADLWLDVAEFRSLLKQSHTQNDVALRISLLSDAVKLYRNHFLTGFSLKDSSAFNEWTFAESEELRRQLADALTILSEDYCGLGQADKAIPYARRLVSLDALNESSHRQLMEVYLQAGQHSAALKQYQTCEQILRKELDLDPQPETRALYKKIRKGEIKPVENTEQIATITPKHNLPAQLTAFIGRETEQEEIIKLLAKNRLVTLAGVGGIGKTRLSLQMGHKLLNEYPDGIWFVALDSLTDPALLPQTIALVFDIRERADRPITEILMNVLREKTALLIFDNCEHLLDACAQFITKLLQNCPNLKILATSREILNVAGEATYYVPSLSMPEDDDAAVEKLTEFESIRLFTDRAALALSSFRLTNENAQTVMDICRRVDGIPLAIELAATRVNILQVEEILKQLQNSFALLSSDGRTTLPRQQTLRASMDWSWGLLSEAEQIFLRQLSVFAGGWTLESAQAVCDGDVLPLTNALAKKSLIAVNQETGRETRYRFHEMVRQYVRQKLVESGEEADIQARHLKYFLQLSEQAETALRGFMQVKWYERLNEERDNIRAALEWAAKTDVEAGLYLSGRLKRFWESFDLKEGVRWLAEFTQRPESKSFHQARAKALHAQVLLLIWMLQPERAHSAAQECLELYRRCRDRYGEIDALLVLAQATYQLDYLPQITELAQQALSFSESLGDIPRRAASLNLLANCYHDLKRSYNYFEQAISLYRQIKDWSSLAFCLSERGQQALLNGDLQGAEEYLKEATALYRQLKNRTWLGATLQIYGRIVFSGGDIDQARASMKESMEISQETGNRMLYLWSRTHWGYFVLRQGDITQARDILTESMREFSTEKIEQGVVFALEGMASLFVVVGKPENAARLIGWSDAMREKINDRRPLFEQADVDKIIAACLAKMGEVAFSDAYDEGQNMSLDEAVAYTLGES